jgi:trehalose-phosphatase
MNSLPLLTTDTFSEAIVKRIRGRIPIVFLDYDGTLSEIVENPEKAYPSGEMISTILELASHCSVSIVTGRGLDALHNFVGDEVFHSVHIAASHGFVIHLKDGSVHSEGAPGDIAEFELFVSCLRDTLPLFPPGTHIEKSSRAASVHYRHVDPGRIPEVHTALSRIAAEFPSIVITHGKMVLECRIGSEWNKGKGVEWILENVAGRTPHEELFLMYIGDDVTDEDAFRFISQFPHHASILVDANEEIKRETLAEFRLPNVESVLQFLTQLVSVVQE